MARPNFQPVFAILEEEHRLTMLEQLSSYNVFQQLIATLLSARTKDTTTIPIVKELFKEYKTPQDFLKISLFELEQKLYGIGFYKVKSKNIKKLSKIILDRFGGRVPDTLEQLISLPGVGRKTANCLLNYAFSKPAIAVDVHVHRISNRLGWVHTRTPEETEIMLQKIIPKEYWSKINMLFVGHGQRVCLPIKPKCAGCNIKKFCRYGLTVHRFSHL
jgi:endonuclease-3